MGEGKGGRVPPLTAKTLPKIGKKTGKIGKKSGEIGKKEEKSGRNGKNREISFTLSLLTDRAGYATGEGAHRPIVRRHVSAIIRGGSFTLNPPLVLICENPPVHPPPPAWRARADEHPGTSIIIKWNGHIRRLVILYGWADCTWALWNESESPCAEADIVFPRM